MRLDSIGMDLICELAAAVVVVEVVATALGGTGNRREFVLLAFNDDEIEDDE